MFFLQMSGFPGSGKSTLAQEIGRRTGAVVIDHDVIKSGLLKDYEGDPKKSGPIAYNIDWSLIEFQLSQGHAVIFDSPCLYQEMVGRGIELTEKFHIKYKYVECYLDDFIEVNRRLKHRVKMPSQIAQAASIESFQYTIKNSQRPLKHDYFVVDTKQSISHYIDDVMKYINN
ncbi:ATP-binding protein [Filobacillus milosensis]|uniref:ATP-binding protein n=1 Tax=Filobacillus milosensis TaxID=94137 RepID=A0A4Y8ISE3_9BACI|nr:AAA family ATPase [Filobacillus milosensis]TFB22922.1 ATP-binding protein [Filobacillus milosensis]